jgi:hypothetical protein
MRVTSAFLITLAFSTLPMSAQQPPASIDPPTGARIVLQAKGDGVQIYTCTQTSDVLKWVLKAPDAKLLDDSGKIIGSHYAGPSWKLVDGSLVQGVLIANHPAPEPGSIPWLLLRAKEGTPTGKLADVAFIRRTETHGGVAPSTGCQDANDVGKITQIPYTAAYTFYAAQ